jgi:hypothetical protein
VLEPDTLLPVLGTNPSVATLSATPYYGHHPTNAFWWIVGNCLGFRRAAGTEKTNGGELSSTCWAATADVDADDIKTRHVDCRFESPTVDPPSGSSFSMILDGNRRYFQSRSNIMHPGVFVTTHFTRQSIGPLVAATVWPPSPPSAAAAASWSAPIHKSVITLASVCAKLGAGHHSPALITAIDGRGDWWVATGTTHQRTRSPIRPGRHRRCCCLSPLINGTTIS